MAHIPDHSHAGSQVILLGDHDTVRRDRDRMCEQATLLGCVIVQAFSFAPGEAASADDLTEINAVVSALGHAIAHRLHIWVPFPGPDSGGSSTGGASAWCCSATASISGSVGNSTRARPTAASTKSTTRCDVRSARSMISTTRSLRPRALKAFGVKSNWRSLVRAPRCPPHRQRCDELRQVWEQSPMRAWRV